MTLRPKILVVDGYKQDAREELVSGGATVAAELYIRMLESLYPNILCDKIFPSDPSASIPQGSNLSDYDGVAWTGCSLTVFEDNLEVRRQIEFARECFQLGIPGFGSCWAAQIAIVAAGGSCRGAGGGSARGTRIQ